MEHDDNWLIIGFVAAMLAVVSFFLNMPVSIAFGVVLLISIYKLFKD